MYWNQFCLFCGTLLALPKTRCQVDSTSVGNAKDWDSTYLHYRKNLPFHAVDLKTFFFFLMVVATSGLFSFLFDSHYYVCSLIHNTPPPLPYKRGLASNPNPTYTQPISKASGYTAANKRIFNLYSELYCVQSFLPHS